MFILRQKRFLAFCLFAAIAGTVPSVTLAVRNHHDAPAELATMVLIGIVCGLGLALLIALVVFTVYRSFFTAPPAIALAPYEDVLASMPANSYRDGEARGGTLFVTQRRLIFVPHRFNFQLESTFIPWDDIRGCLPIPASPLTQTTLTIELRNGSEQRLVVYNRQALMGYIERMRRLVESERAVASGVLLLALGIGQLASRSSPRQSPSAAPECTSAAPECTSVSPARGEVAEDDGRGVTTQTIVQATELPVDDEQRDAKTVVTAAPVEISRRASSVEQAVEALAANTVVQEVPLEISVSLRGCP